MTKKEFCEIMAAGHQQAYEEMLHVARRAADRNADHNANAAYASAKEQQVLASAFRDLAKEQPE